MGNTTASTLFQLRRTVNFPNLQKNLTRKRCWTCSSTYDWEKHIIFTFYTANDTTLLGGAKWRRSAVQWNLQIHSLCVHDEDSSRCTENERSNSLHHIGLMVQ